LQRESNAPSCKQPGSQGWKAAVLTLLIDMCGFIGIARMPRPRDERRSDIVDIRIRVNCRLTVVDEKKL